MTKANVDPALVYQLKITLEGIEPAIWRRLEVQNTTLERLSHFLVVAMGWSGGHLYQLEIQGKQYGELDPDFDDFGMFELNDASQFLMSDLLAGKVKNFSFVYDFGDDWRHRVTIEQKAPPLAGRRYPACTGGEGACPPEDVGGIPGYAYFLEAIGDSAHPEHDEFLEWVGGGFDPGELDLADTNNLLAQVADEGPWWDGEEESEAEIVTEDELQDGLTGILDRVASEAERFIIVRDDQALAALVPLEELQALKELDAFVALIESKGGWEAVREELEKEGE